MFRKRSCEKWSYSIYILFIKVPIKIKEERGIHFLLSLALPLEIPEVPQSYLLRVIMLIGVILQNGNKTILWYRTTI